MKEKLLTYLASNRLMSVLFIVFPTAMGIGTFLETWYSTDAAKIWIYNAWWFELIMVLFVFSFIGNMFKYKLFRKEKWAVLSIHLSFVLILVGAFITRYIGYEGVMPIQEGESTNIFLSEKTYLEVLVDGEFDGQALRKPITEELLLSEHVDHDFVIKDDFKGQDFSIHFVDYLENATEGLVLDPEGDRYLKIVEASDGSRHDHYLKEGEVVNIHNLLFTLNKPIDGATNIQVIDGEYFVSSPFEGTFMRMADQFEGKLIKDSIQPLQLRSLYALPNFQFVIPEPVLRGKFDIVKADEEVAGQQDALRLEIKTGDTTELITVLGGKGVTNDPKKIEVGSLEFYVKYGSKTYELPFNIRLKDFIAERYPGTEKSYSSFKSKIVVEAKESYDYDIYMNHVLDQEGYRFFQSSFTPDEKGTVLSVNHDFWGTWVTYIGYFMLYASMMGIFFIGKTRFKNLAKSLDKIKLQKSKLTVLLLLSLSMGWSQSIDHPRTQVDFDSLVVADAFSKEQAAKFGSLVIQDLGGRMKPANTFSSELLRKVSKSDTYKGLDSNQVLLSILNAPVVWYNIPIIYLKSGNDSIRAITGVEAKAKYASLGSFFDATGVYKLSSQLESAYRAAIPNKFQTDFIEVDKRVNLLYSALEGKVLRIFPIPGDENNKWVSFPEIQEANFKGTDSLYVRNVLPLYFQSLRAGKATNDFKQATELLESLSGFQKRYGAEVMPSEDRIATEILYNKYDIFKKIFSWYLYVGMLFLIILLVQIFKDSKAIRVSISFFKASIVFLFLLHTAGLIARWYISGHAPWSDAYESMIYVAWATMFFGLAFGRKSNLTMAATTFVAAMILMIAHWNWMDPAIANLQPVLDSYWLMIHVAVIVGSYGPFALSMIIGIVALLLILLTTKKNKERMALNIKELTIINELSLTVGLIMLTIGNFLGGMWANESWGRYWGWDPKETWALISIMIYAFVIHMRLIPALKSCWMFNLSSIVAFGSIMMTYFGVNFYLSGLHSYASGDKIITPDFVYYALVFVTLLGGSSYWRFKKMYR
jgi:cytochrome c-type biogenesis protein CcsB